MIKVFSNNETEFQTNGEAVIIPTKAKVKNADNGDFYLELTCHSKYKDYIQANNIIVAPTPSGEQPFRIRTVTKKGFKLEVKAWHLYYDSVNYLIADSYAVDLDCNAAMNHFNSATDVTSPFKVYSNISDKNTYRCVRTSLSDCFKTIIERWGGHLVRDKWNISILSSIGKDNGITIEYGKNLSDINAEYDWTDVVTKLLPVGKDGILLDSLYVYSQIQYDLHFCKTISFEQNINEEDYQSQEEYIAALKADLLIQATNYLDKYQYPQVNYNVKGRPELVSDIGDIIRVHDKRLGIDITTQVIAYEYDAITGRYTSLEFGNFGKTLSDIVAAINSSINNKVDKSVVGATGGVASLGSDGKVPVSQLPPAQTVNNGILTIQRNGVEIQTFSANSFDNKTANIEVPTKTSELINNSEFVSDDPAFTEASTRTNIASGESFSTILGKIKKFFADLKTVAFTGAYSDLSGTPTIPTKTSDLTNDSGYITDAGVTGVKGNNESTYRTGNVNLTANNIGAVVDYGNLRDLGANTPASATKTFFDDTIASSAYGLKGAYNNAGEEVSILFGNGKRWGNIIKWGYTDKYIRILRKINGTWQSTDWEKINAGYADKAGADADGNNIASTYLNKSTGGTITGQTRFNASIHGGSGQTIYGGEANISQWYKITLAPNGITPPSGTRRWYMISFTIRLGGDYGSNPHGIIFVCYYVYWDGTNFIYTDATCNATSFGHKIDTVRIYYNQSDPFKLYVAVHNAYSTIWIDHVTYRDTAAAYMDRETTVEAISAIDTTQYISLPIAYISASNSGDFMINRILHPSTDNTYDLGLSSYKWKSVYIGTSGTISSGNTQAVTGGAVYDYHNTATQTVVASKCFLEKSGNVVNLECDGATLNAISSIPSGYRPKRTIQVSADIIDSNTSYHYPGYIRLNSDGSISGGWYKDGEIAHFLSTTDTRYQLYFNTTYIV